MCLVLTIQFVPCSNCYTQRVHLRPRLGHSSCLFLLSSFLRPFRISPNCTSSFFDIALSPIHDSPEGRRLPRTWRSPWYSSTCWLPFSTRKHIPNANSGQPIKVRQSRKKRSCASGVNTMQASGVSYRLCRASFSVRASAHLRCAETKQWACSTGLRHIFIDNRSAVLLHHTTAHGLLRDGMPNDSALIS